MRGGMHGVFAFSEEGRKRLAALLRALLIAQLLLSLATLIFCYNTSVAVMVLLKQIHKITVMVVYGLILLQAYCMKLHYTSGLRLVTLLLRQPHWERGGAVGRAWLAGGGALLANSWLVYAACRSTLKTLMNELSSTLRIGISQYLIEPKWKKLIDTMQIELSCCGAEQPSDWHETPWINIDFLNEQSDLVMKLAGADGKVLLPVTPFSCCTPHVLAACCHDPLQQNGAGGPWGGSPLRAASLHARGCAEAVRRPLNSALFALRCISVLVTLLQVLIAVVTQLLRSSARDAVLRGDFAGAGRGHLFHAPARTRAAGFEATKSPDRTCLRTRCSRQRGVRGRRAARSSGYSYLY